MVTANNALLLMLVAASGFFDLKERKIPNKITFTGILIGILFNIITGGWMGLLQSLLGYVRRLGDLFPAFCDGRHGSRGRQIDGSDRRLDGLALFTGHGALFSFGRWGDGPDLSNLYRKIEGHTQKNDLGIDQSIIPSPEPDGLQQNNRPDPATLRQRWANVQENLYSLWRCHRGRNRTCLAGNQSRDPYFLMKEGGLLEAIIKITKK